MSIRWFLFFFLLIGFASAAAQSAIKPKDAPRKEKHHNKTDELDQKQGVWKYFNAAHQLTREVDYVNDIRNGFSKYYFSNQTVMEETEYRFGVKEGSYKLYYYNQQIKVEGLYAAGKKTDHWYYNYADAQIQNEGNYIRGNKEGVWKYYNHKGELMYSITYNGGIDVREIMASEKKLSEAKKVADLKSTKKRTVATSLSASDSASGKGTIKKK